MAQLCKLTGETKISCDGNVFHELFKFNPHKVPNLSPDVVHGCDLKQGQWGTVGSVISWDYTLDGKRQYAKEIIEAIEEEKKSVAFKVIEGDLVNEYNSFLITVSVDTKGKENVVTWTLDYEKPNENVPEPNSFMKYALKVTKDIESRHL